MANPQRACHQPLRVALPLLWMRQEMSLSMSSFRLVLGILCFAVLMASRAIWTAAPVPPMATDFDFSTRAISEPPPSPRLPRPRLEVDEPARGESKQDRRLDLYGNEIERAIGDYRIDTRGHLYERHSPETAMPRLGRPTT
jgi:hypothetical protein